MGRQGDAPVVLDHILEYSRSTALKAECFILLRHVLCGVAHRTALQQEVASAVRLVVEEITEENFDLSKKAVIQNCLLMLLVAECAGVLGMHWTAHCRHVQ